MNLEHKSNKERKNQMERRFLIKMIPVLVAGYAGMNLRATALPGQAVASQTRADSSDISGKWHFIYQTDGGPRENDAVFKVDGDQVTGKYAAADVKGTYKDGDLNLAFPFDSEEAGMKSTLKMKGKLRDGKLVGTWEFADYNGDFTATRPSGTSGAQPSH